MSSPIGPATAAGPGDLNWVKETAMKRMGMGVVAGLAVWFGSALAAEAQQVQPTGPMSIQAGTATYTYTANVYIPTPMNVKFIVSVQLNGTTMHTYVQNIPNPGVNNF